MVYVCVRRRYSCYFTSATDPKRFKCMTSVHYCNGALFFIIDYCLGTILMIISVSSSVFFWSGRIFSFQLYFGFVF